MTNLNTTTIVDAFQPILPQRIRRLDFDNGFAWIDIRIISRKFDFLSQVLSSGPATFELYCFLCVSANREGMTYASNEQLSKTLHKGKSTIVKAKRALEDLDLIATIPGQNGITVFQVLSLPIHEFHMEVQMQKKTHENTAAVDYEEAVRTFFEKAGMNDVGQGRKQQAMETCRKLENQGYSREEIIYATEWILEGQTGTIYSFGIIPSIIQEATKDYRRIQTGMEIAKNGRQEREERQAEQVKIREQDQRIKQYIQQMDPAVKQELEEMARQNVLNSNNRITRANERMLQIHTDLELMRLVEERFQL